MKKLNGLPTLAAALTAFLACILYRIFTFDGDHGLKWRLPLDLKIYALAGQEVSSGGLLYDAPYIKDLPFTYPPFAGVLFSYLSKLSRDWIIGVWQIGSMVALLVVILLVLRNRSIKLTPLTVYVAVVFTLCAVALEPIQGTLFFGQINIWLMLLVALDFLPRRRLPGIGIGLAAGLKLTPAYLGLVLLFQRRWGAAVGAVLTFAATVGIGYWLIPDAHTFWTESMFNSGRVGVPENPGAMDAKSLLWRLFDVHGGPGWLLIEAVIFFVSCAAILVAIKRNNGAAAMVFGGLSACLVSPFSWYHHFVWVAPLCALILVASNQYLGKRVNGQLAGLLSFLITLAAGFPWLAGPVWYAGSYHHLNDPNSFQPWATLLFSGAAFIYMLVYALSGFWIRTGRHAA